MAGSRHHQIPQLLMRGFASRTIPKKKGDTVFVWVHRKNAAPFECSTVDVGVEKKFYSDETVSVDGAITELEGPFAECLNKLRRCADGFRVTDSTFLEFVVHMTSRTKHVRDSFTNSMGVLSDELFSYLSENWREYFGRYFAKNRDVIRNELKESLMKNNASSVQRVIANQLLNSLTADKMVRIIETTDNYDLWFPLMREYLSAQLNDLVKQAHIKSLLTSLVPEPRVEHFQEFHWYVRRSSETLILGDVCCSFQIDSKFTSLGGVQENIQSIHVPISSDCVIVASLTDELPSINPGALNEVSAKISREYFVTKERSPEMSRLQTLIGTDSEFLTKAELQQIMNEVIEESL